MFWKCFVKICIKRENIHQFISLSQPIIPVFSVVSTFFDILIGQRKNRMIVNAGFSAQVELQIGHHPLLRIVIPFCVFQLFVIVLNQSVVTRNITCFAHVKTPRPFSHFAKLITDF